MDSDMKWAILAFTFFMGIPFVGLGLSQYQQHQCRIAGIEKGLDAENIIKLCKETK